MFQYSETTKTIPAGMIEVRIRTADKESGPVLGYFPPEALGGVVTMLKRESVYFADNGDTYGGEPMTQFVADDDRVYFEIVFGAD